MKSVTYILLRQRVDKLGQDLVGNDGLSELVRVGSESAEGKGSRLLDGRNVIEEKRSQEGHNTYQRKS